MHFSEETKEILERREEAIIEGDEEKFDRLTKEFRKSKAKDKKEGIMETIKNELDVRDQWAGIRRIKGKYQPMPFARQEKYFGEHVHMSKRAEMAAQYLMREQWGKKETEEEETERRSKWQRRRIIRKDQEEYRVCEIELWEIKAIIKKT